MEILQLGEEPKRHKVYPSLGEGNGLNVCAFSRFVVKA